MRRFVIEPLSYRARFVTASPATRGNVERSEQGHQRKDHRPMSATPTDLAALANPAPVDNPGPAPVEVPGEIKAFVTHLHEAWETAPKRWHAVELSTEEAVKEVRKLAARHARAMGWAFRTKNNSKPTTLMCKVMDKPEPAAYQLLDAVASSEMPAVTLGPPLAAETPKGKGDDKRAK